MSIPGRKGITNTGVKCKQLRAHWTFHIERNTHFNIQSNLNSVLFKFLVFFILNLLLSTLQSKFNFLCETLISKFDI